MTMLSRFRQPGQLMMVRAVDAWTQEVQRGPWVALVGKDLLQEPALARVLKLWGYRRVVYLADCRAWLYVRPLPLWWLHKSGHALYGLGWWIMVWLWKHKVFRLAAAEGTRFRWRQIRPWFMAGRGHGDVA